MNLNDRVETLDDNLKLNPAERAQAVTFTASCKVRGRGW